MGFEETFFFVGLAVGNAVVGAVGGLNQTHLRSLLGFASINQLGWLLGLVVVSGGGAIIYLILYSILLFPLFLVLIRGRVFSVKVMGRVVEMGAWVAWGFGFLVLRLAGIPPLGGFFLKGYALSLLIDGGYGGLALLLVFGSVVALAYYLNLLILRVVSGVGVGRVDRGGRVFWFWPTLFSLISVVRVPVFIGGCLL